MITLALMTYAIRIRKFIFIGVLISSLDLINFLQLKLRANGPIITLVLDTGRRNQNESIFFIFLDISFFLLCLRNY